MSVIDLGEQKLNDQYPQDLSLLHNRTTGGNITWSYDGYRSACANLSFEAEIAPENLTGIYSALIKPRS